MAKEMQYLKFVVALIDSGIWARMTPAARALYPVLLRFSDGHYKPVYPGTKRLLELTGFRQKASLRKARRELEDLRLISASRGSGTRNTLYRFHFEGVGGATESPRGATGDPAPGHPDAIGGPGMDPRGAHGMTPPYNQIQISINHHVPDSGIEGLRVRFGDEMLRAAESECRLAGRDATAGNLEKILYQHSAPHGASWADVESYLGPRVSPGSLSMIKNSFKEHQNGVFVFRDDLPEHLRELLANVCGNVFFEPDLLTQNRRDYWRSLDGSP